MTLKLGIDVGGTFTDFALFDDEGNVDIMKTTSTADPSGAISLGLKLLSKKHGVTVEEFLNQHSLIIHGTTVATNAIIQGKLPKLGLITTEGFRDILETRQGQKEERYDWLYPLPPMLIPRDLRVSVEERVLKDGRVYKPLNEGDVLKAIDKFKKESTEAVAVCFLWSFMNATHEKRVRDMLCEYLPGVYVSISSEVLPQIREYPRVSTTAINVALGPKMVEYIDHLEGLLRSLNYTGQIRYMQSNGGIASGESVKRKPVLTINSGPAAGPVAGLYFGRLFHKKNIITIDMGGTSFDACLTYNRIMDTVKNVDVHRFRIGLPTINVRTIGAGGGSIAWIDTGGRLRVGPQSAEAIPGPACYDKGGQQPTVTDANVVLGYFNPEYLLGDKLSINSELSRKVIEGKIGEPLGLSLPRAALGIFEIVNSNMANGVRAISVEQGYDTRDFTLIVGGGCGPTHACRLAEALELSTILIPRIASAFCAFGCIVADIKHDYTRTYAKRFSDIDYKELNLYFGEMEKEAYKDLKLEGISKDKAFIQRTVDIRYVGESSECTVLIPTFEITEQRRPEIEEAFDKEHERRYTFRDPATMREIINLGVTAYGSEPDIEIRESPFSGSDPSKAKKISRKVFFPEYNDYVDTPIFDGGKIQTGNIIDGPAIIEEETTTIVVFPKWQIRLDGRNVYVMSRLDKNSQDDSSKYTEIL